MPQHRSRLGTALAVLLWALSLALAPFPAAQAAASAPTAVTVTVLEYPSTVGIGQPITIRWQISGGTNVEQTRVQWALQSGYYEWDSETTYTGGPGVYEHTFSLAYAATVYFTIFARVDGANYYATENVLFVNCAESYEPNNSRAQARSVAIDQSYVACLTSTDIEDWYAVAVPSCSALEALAAPAQGPVGYGSGVVIELYNSAGTLIAAEEPSCGGGGGRCDPVAVYAPFPTGGTAYVRVWGDARSYTLVLSRRALNLITNEFDERPYDANWLPRNWSWVDPLHDTDYDPEFVGGVWWMRSPGGGAHDLHTTTNAPRLVQWVCGDFAVETDLTLARTGSYQGAGLLVWQDASNFLRWEVNDSGALRAFRMRGGVWTDMGNLTYLGAHVRLRLQRVGQRLDYLALVQGVWTYYGSLDLTGGAVQVGPYLTNYGAAGAASATFDYVRSVAALPIGPTPTPGAIVTPPTPFRWTGEAEQGTLTAPMAVYTATAASGGAYVASATGNAGEVTFPITVPVAGNYTLWARVQGQGFTNNSFSVAWDSAAQIHYEVPQFGGQWAWGWDRVHLVDAPEAPFALTAGAHTLHVRGREPNTRLDALLLTNNPAEVPGDVTPTPTATATPTPTILPSITPTPGTPTATSTPGATPTSTPTLPARLWLPLLYR